LKSPFLSDLRGEDDLSSRALRYSDGSPILRVFEAECGKMAENKGERQ
jgi:hypothetical protein